MVNIVTGDGRDRRRARRRADVDKIAFTGSTEVGKAIQRRLAGTGKKLTLELGGKAANIVFDDAALDQAVEGIVNGIYFNQGHVCCAGSRLFVQESIAEPVVDKLKRRMATLRVGDPLDKNTDVGAINSQAQLEKIQELVAAGERGGRRDLPAAVPAAREGLLVRADRVHERGAELPHRAGGDLRPGALRAHVPDARRGGREGEQHAVRPLRGRLDGEGLAHPLDGRAAARRRRLGEHVQPLRPDEPVRRLQGVGLRPRGRPARPRAVPRVRRPRLSRFDGSRSGGARRDEDALAAHRPRDVDVGSRARAGAAGRTTDVLRRADCARGRARRRARRRVAGYVAARAARRRFARRGHVLMVNGIAVDPAVAAGAASAARSSTAARRGARAAARRRLTLRVLARRTSGARRLYESAGFVVEGVQRGEFFLDGQYVDDVLMALDLTT